MSSSTYRISAPYERPPLRRRAAGMALALGFNLLLLLALMTLGLFPRDLPTGGVPTIVDLLPSERESTASRTRPETRRAPTEKATEPLRKPLPKPPIVIPSKPTIEPPPWVEMTSEEMAAADIANMPKVAEGPAPGDSEEVGRAPNGELLYAAEWARKPTNAELGGYLPRNAPDGYGLIACRTAPQNRVEDCVELDQFPRGSHLASAVRQAAWQFRVRPPRKNGKPMIGSWVRIKIEYYTERS